MITLNEYLSTKVKQTKIKATNADIKEIVHSEIQRLGQDADLNHIDVSSVTNFSKVFYLKDFSGDVSLWDVSNGTNFALCFAGNKSFDGDLTEWNVENAEIFNKMFALDRMFTGIGLENWKVNNCLEFDNMFAGCKNFNADISNWEISLKARSFTSMFKECENFTQDLSKWKLPKYSCQIDMFWHCPLARRRKSQPQDI